MTILALYHDEAYTAIFSDRRMTWRDAATGILIDWTETTDPRRFQSDDPDELGKPHLKVWAHTERRVVWAAGGTSQLFYKCQWREACDVIFDWLTELPPAKQFDLDELIDFLRAKVIERGHNSLHLVIGTQTEARYVWFPESADRAPDVEQIEGGRIYASPDTEPYFADRYTSVPPIPGKSPEQVIVEVRSVLENAIAYAHQTVGADQADVGGVVDVAVCDNAGARILEEAT